MKKPKPKFLKYHFTCYSYATTTTGGYFAIQISSQTTKKETCYSYATTTIGGYFAIQISSQTTKKEISESPLLRTIIPHKLLTFCDTITFAPVPSQVLHNS